MTYIGFPIMSLMFIVIFLVIYFSKERINLFENKVVIAMMILNGIGLLLELGCYVVMAGLKAENTFLGMLELKSYIAYIPLLNLLLTGYIFMITNKEYNNPKYDMKKYFFNVMKIFGPLTLLIIIVIFIAPLHYNDVYPKYYTYGLATDCVLYSMVILFPIWIGKILYSMFNNKNQKVNPQIYLLLIGIIIVGCTGAITNLLDKSILIITSAETIMLTLIYLTIENPDMKMAQQLELAKNQADKANAAKTDFLSSMSHEIRTPLNAIVGFSDLISEAKTLDEAKTNAKDIVNASQTLLEIVNGILDISKIEAGKLEIKESPYNAKEIFEDLAKLIKPRMDERGLDFSYYIAPDIPTTLYGDHANIKKIVTNFLSNAAKYTEKGYVKYEVNCVNNNGVCKLIVSVEDSGRGIKKESVNKLFEKFDRLDVERNTTVEGTGLGLAITKQLVEMMGGKIIVHTVYGEGSKFTVMIDQKIETTQVVETEKVADTLDLTGVNILLVDDNDLNLKVGSKLLEKFNADKIDLAKNGFECIDKVRDNKYDLILLDDMMPKKSGTETLKELKALPNFNTPTVALTANAIAGMREAYIAAGFDEYLAKPIERQDLIKVVNKLLKDKSSNEVVEETPQQEEISQPVEEPQPEVPQPVEAHQPEMPQPEASQPIEEPQPEEKHVVDNVLPTNATEAPTEDTNTVIDNQIPINNSTPVDSQIPIPVEPTRESDEEFLRHRGVDMDKALELLGDMEMYNMTMDDFSKELENKWSKLEEEKLQNDMENYAIDVHSLKSDCKYLGFYDLADVAYEHELKSKENDSNFVNENFERLANEYLKVLNIVKEYKDRLKS